MKLRISFFLLTVLSSALAFNLTISDAELSDQWHLPDGVRARLNKGSINGIAYSADSSRFAVASSIGVWVYDTATDGEVALIGAHTSWVHSVSFSPDGSTLATGNWDGTVRLWDAETGALRNTLPAQGAPVRSVSFSPDGSTLASASGRTVSLWDVATSNKDALGRHTDTVTSLMWTADGGTLASVSDDGTVRLWNMETRTARNTLDHPNVASAAFSPDGSMIATGGGYELRLWDATNGTLQNFHTSNRENDDYNATIKSVAYSADGKTLAVGTARDQHRIYTNDGYTRFSRNTVHLIDLDFLNATNNFYIVNRLTGYTSVNRLTGHTSDIISLTYSADGSTFASASNDGSVRLWNATTATLRNELTGYNTAVYSVAMSPDSKDIATGNWDGTVHLLDVATGTLKNRLTGHTLGISSVAFSPDGKTLASGSWDSTARIWSAAGSHQHTIDRSSGVTSVAYSADGASLTVGEWDYAYEWDVVSGEYKSRLQRDTGYVWSIAYSADGIKVAAGCDNFLFLRNDTVNFYLTEHVGPVRGVAFSPDSATLVSGGADGTVRLWNAADGTHKNTLLTEHVGEVFSVAFSPDGDMIASSGADGTVRLWDAADGTLKNTLIGHTGWVRSIAFSPEGQTIASASGDGTVLLWRVPSAIAPLAFTTSTVADQTFTIGTPVTLTLPIATGGAPPYTYSLSAPPATATEVAQNLGTPYTYNISALPAGLHFAAATRHLSGTPTTLTTATSFTYTVTDADGTIALLRFKITVTGTPAAGITFLPNVIPDQRFTVNTAIAELDLPQALGGTPPYTYTLTPTPPGLAFDAAARSLTGTPTTLGTTDITYAAADATGADVSLTFTIEVTAFNPLDANRDGEVTILDLVLVALNFGKIVSAEGHPADVNADGQVDVADLVEVAGALTDSAAAPFIADELPAIEALETLHAADMEQWLLQAQQLNLTDVTSQRGILFLQQLLAVLTPKQTALLANYPNPFNPETWIPYQLATPAEVSLTIYDIQGRVVRILDLGHQAIGIYENRSRAAYWDGRNAVGEPVASGVYFYTLTADEFTATRKLLIRK